MKLESLKPGMLVYDVCRQRMGHTTMTTVAVYYVRVVEIDLKNRIAVASWNGNPPRNHYERAVKRWRKSKPVIIRTPMGRSRLATREELKALRVKGENV